MIIEIVIGILIVILIFVVIGNVLDKLDEKGRSSDYGINERRNEDD